MPRQLSVRRFYLSGKNKISISNPCHSRTLQCLWRLLLLVLLCYLIVLWQSGQQDGAPALVADVALRQRVQIFCIIVTYGHRHEGVGVHVKRTWTKHCNQYLFVSDDSHEELEPAVFMHRPDKWQRMRAHMEYVYKYHYFDENHWFLYANDDNFVVVENLRFMLQHHNSNEPIYFGCKLRTPQNETYMYGASAMVLSSEALVRFVLQALPNASLCSQEDHGDAADEQFGICMSNVKVLAGDSRDVWSNHTFLPFEAEVHVGSRMNASLEKHKYFLDRSYYEVHNLRLPVSKYSISYHVEYMPDIYDLYYFTHLVNIFGQIQHKDIQNAFGSADVKP
ncbi:glycoprotein-N-acetylgalactosamine 3-beta-galactosyltransferase 1 [Scaptodrosophila lebanonensis]|uniref:N-acetylgalactosaminide beta-1,3-galactosyltransferase n=1 Tax=Drosophila lebanonensis TaxID=7225 RepID=A0A6J2TB38_DROLE|nr:glycoprotein-N-acetylgalactosamine 3-beta-galactosyltransferase 1 [Scaptodrosophila lebanonensis]